MDKKILLIVFTICSFSCKYKSETKISDKLNLIVDNKKQGPFIRFYSTGKIKSFINYKNDVKDGQSIDFYENGNIYIESHYKNGNEDGICYVFYSSGYLKSVREFEHGLNKDLGYDYFDSLASIKAMLYFNDKGKLQERNNYDLKGNLIKKEGVIPYILSSKNIPIISN
jgi:antitoxin component YwqK of YwqJK toxin-antitoxin module